MPEEIFDNKNYKWPEKRYFSAIINPKHDITHILAQEWINNIALSDTDPDTNAKISLQHILQEIKENTKDIEVYLDFLRLVTGAEDYEPALTKSIDQNYKFRKKTHDEINNWMHVQIIEVDDTTILPHLNNILSQQQKIIAAIADEMPKAQKLIKSNILQIAEYEKIFSNLQQTAEYIMLKGMTLEDFSNTDKNNIDPSERNIFENLRKNVVHYRERADKIQTDICTFLGERAAEEKNAHIIYTKYKELRKRANQFDADTQIYYNLMIKYDK